MGSPDLPEFAAANFCTCRSFTLFLFTTVKDSQISVAEPHHFNAAPVKNLDASPAHTLT
jgi:hypothetical protein